MAHIFVRQSIMQPIACPLPRNSVFVISSTVFVEYVKTYVNSSIINLSWEHSFRTHSTSSRFPFSISTTFYVLHCASLSAQWVFCDRDLVIKQKIRDVQTYLLAPLDIICTVRTVSRVTYKITVWISTSNYNRCIDFALFNRKLNYFHSTYLGPPYWNFSRFWRIITQLLV